MLFRSALSVLALAILGAILGDPRIQWGEVPVMIITAGVYAALLAVPLIPFVRWACRKVIPDAFPR